jgi:hypothetical protein
MKTQRKPLSVHSDPAKVKLAISNLEGQIQNCQSPIQRSRLKKELNILYRLRHKQKNYTPPPRKINLKGL